jgi:hypothetical protein
MNLANPVFDKEETEPIESAKLMNADSNTNGFKRHKIHFSPKSEMAAELSQTPPSSSVNGAVFVTPGIYKRKVCKTRVKEVGSFLFNQISGVLG